MPSSLLSAVPMASSCSSVLTQPSLQAVKNTETASHFLVMEECPLVSFPRFLPLLGWPRSSPNKLIVSQSLAKNTIDYGLESVGVIGFPSIEAESLFVKVFGQMKCFNADVGSFDCSFQETPEVFNTIGVNMTVDVSLSVVNDLVDILGVQIIIGRERIGDKVATLF